jgi:hypothetical protein
MPLVLKNGYPTTEELVCLHLAKKEYNSCPTCISHTISHGTPSEYPLAQCTRESSRKLHLKRQESATFLLEILRVGTALYYLLLDINVRH